MKKDRFKFRAWNKSDKIMHYDAQDTYDYMSGDPIIECVNFCHLLQDDDYIVEQCTGLKDKNGNLIYENDYLKNPKGNITFVSWDCGDAKFSLGDGSDDMEHLNCYEIIGNINEDKE